MTQLFISHSSLDNAESIALYNWLSELGWSLFLDLDPNNGIHVGEEWRKKLGSSINECEGMILLISDNWLISPHCLSEYQMAAALNKPIFPLIIKSPTKYHIPHAILDKWNIGNLEIGHPKVTIPILLPSGQSSMVAFSQSGLNGLKRGLTYAGLHPDFFQWPPLSRYDNPPSPYKGLKPLEFEDAGLLFGRDGAIKALLSELQRLRETTQIRFVAIQGASGSGKSSFLRAGILPRLARLQQQFLVLPLIRPNQLVLSGEKGLIEALFQLCKKLDIRRTKKSIKELVTKPTLRIALKAFLLCILRRARGKLEFQQNSDLPTLIISVDQAEELFTSYNEETSQFLQLIAELIHCDELDVMVLSTIRTDAYSALQVAEKLEGIDQYPFSLPPIAKGAYQQIIEGPAKLLEKTQKPLWIDPQLTDRLLKDLEQDGGKDALPLLAFTLERLYLDYGSNGKLELKEYLTFQDEYTQQHSGLGGLQGAVSIAIDEALTKAQQDPRLPKNHNDRIMLLRRAIIPYLASIDVKTHQPHRKVAHYIDFPEDVRPIIDSLVESRLLTKDYNAQFLDNKRKHSNEQGITVEFAHESILRQWRLLSDWLKEDIADLFLLEMLQAETIVWLRTQKHTEWLRLSGCRLQEMDRLEQGKFKAYLTPVQREYLDCCRVQEQLQQVNELRKARALITVRSRALKRVKMSLGISSLLLILSIGVGCFAFDKKQEAEQQTLKYQMELERSETLLHEISTAVSFLNFDLRNVLEQYVPATKQVVIYQEIEKLIQHLEENTCYEGLREIAVAYMNQGNHAKELGDVDKASFYYQRAFAEFQYLADKTPNDLEIQHDLSMAYENIGHLAEIQQDLNSAEQSYQAVLGIRQKLVQKDPTNFKLQGSLSHIYKKLGDISQLMNQFEQSLFYYQNAFNIDQDIYQKNPEHYDVQRELSISYYNLGHLMQTQYQYAQAFNYYQKEFTIIDKLVKQDPKNQQILHDLSMIYERLGDVKLAENNQKEALDYYQRKLNIAKKQILQDPDNLQIQHNLASSYDKVGNVFRIQKQFDQALLYYQEAFTIFHDIDDKYPNHRQNQRSLGISYAKLASIALSQEDIKKASNHYHQAFDIFEHLSEERPANQQIQRILGILYYKLGDIALAEGNTIHASERYQSGFTIIHKLYLNSPNSPWVQADLARSYERLGDFARLQQNYTQSHYYYQQSLEIAQTLLAKQPKNYRLFRRTATVHQKLGDVLSHFDKSEQSVFHNMKYNMLKGTWDTKSMAKKK
ncbi:TIR domain-containing protein [Pasteurella canis]|uniref:nSTAND1 domain-containing NTPase n=1 Tax=Pasteurella canis TaxID=753 RepID=UPI001E40822A|nr:TIR domain-containing protein [Pasteurella canis]UEA17570.1 TIR domain-containing protein [Pasteurella canis]